MKRKPPSKKSTKSALHRVIDVMDVMPFSPEGAAKDYESRMLIDNLSAGSKRLIMNHFTLFPKRSTYPGAHRPPYDEIYYILRGRGVLTLDGPKGKRFRVGPDTVVFIPGGTCHQLENTGTRPLEMLTIMPLLPKSGVNTLYDARLKQWGTSFRLIKTARKKK